ncbi:hypothetical protein HB364_16625 [Pseudoflavitalea sp. X16]|uniref:hypothetical protein n=1 Tax=Paraflavitalea devenefica TaxID=2716334 RepID=UPI001423A689|nr:hypothetical protein [Paraflavitalea devenefica]NII26715.1 hypothetical protein [Paraflavitalea devenefica]
MKKYLLGVFALVLAIGFSSFGTMEKLSFRYLIFTPATGSSNEILQSNYTDNGTSEPSVECEGAAKVCWIRVQDSDENGSISSTEFANQVVVLDTDSPKNNLIADDQTPDDVTYTEKP